PARPRWPRPRAPASSPRTRPSAGPPRRCSSSSGPARGRRQRGCSLPSCRMTRATPQGAECPAETVTRQRETETLSEGARDGSDGRFRAVPRAVLEGCGPSPGFTADTEHYLPRLLGPAALCFLPRRLAEDDPSFKQLIPYVVLRCGGLVFHYRRGRAG